MNVVTVSCPTELGLKASKMDRLIKYTQTLRSRSHYLSVNTIKNAP